MTRPEDSPWALPVAQLGSHAGQSTQLDMAMPAPDGIGDEVIGITAGTPVRVTGSFDSIIDGLILSGHVAAAAHAECSRCLKPIHRTWGADVTAFFPFDGSRDATAAHGPASGDYTVEAGQDEAGDEDIYPLSPDGAYADLERLLRDTLVEALPLQPLCRSDCKGLCPECGINLNMHPGHHHEHTDTRFAALADLRDKLERGRQE